MNWTAALLALMGGVRPEGGREREPINRIDVENLSEDRKRDIGLLDGRRGRGEPEDFSRSIL